MILLKGAWWNLRVFIEPRDVWIGVFVKTKRHIYVCPLPCVVFEWWLAAPEVRR